MNKLEREKNIKSFVEYWKDKGYEKGESQKFWIDLLEHILGVENAREHISFEDQIKIDKTSFIDGYIPATKVLIEQKSSKVDLNSGIKQSDGSMLTPYQQALRYNDKQIYSKKARWIITCNFKEFYIYDMEKSNPQPEVIKLKDLLKEYYRLEFIVNKENENIKKEMEISIKAGELVGILYDALLKQYNEKDEEELKSLNELCVRLVFCLYAEDSGLFGEKLAFHNYLQSFQIKDTRRALIDLFKVLDTKIEERDKYLDEDLAKFPYVNGGLFANEKIIIPHLTQEIVDIILHKASEDFDWSEISPTIFGAVFESTLNPETRRSGGMHYTSIENIHKVIDPLFLDELKEELEKIKEVKVEKLRKQQLEEFTQKLSSLNFLDPACGSGNFLTETYISLRRLENEALELIHKGQSVFYEIGNVIKVSIGQFYGIEINDFAVTVAKTALWISESQMMKETERIVKKQLDFFPLKSYANIIEGNALRIDWEEVVPKEKLSYIMGNPPFVGYKFQTKEQKEDIVAIAGVFDNFGTLDYVSCWYIKASKLMKNTNIKTAFVSTNSVCQGEHVSTLWKPLFNFGISIFFAYRTFKWNSEAKDKAAVHCVIVGFQNGDISNKKILWDESNNKKLVNTINGYLLDAPNVFIDKSNNPICLSVPIATKGNAAMDNGNLTFSKETRDEILKKEPYLESVIKRHMSADDFLNAHENYCLWLYQIDITKYRNSFEVQKRLKAVQEYRASSNRQATKKMADYPMLFAEIRQPKTNYIMMPVVSTERRKYIPIAFLSPDIINSYASISIPNATIYHFGILMSNVHNAWMRAVCGRLKSDYRYSTTLVYNNFPWPAPTDKQKENIEKTAQMILDARNLYPDSSLADLYDEVTMPPELRKAHQLNDKAVMEAYGFWGKIKTESECVAELMKMYQKLTNNKG